MVQEEMNKDLIAPCGMNCSLCSAYLACTHKIPKKRGKVGYCIGCRPRNKECSFIKKRCETLKKKEIDFCFECSNFPCKILERVVKGYKKYNYSIINNLNFIRDNGLESFITKEKEQYCCARCGDTVCIHNNKCYSCDRKNLI